MAQDLSPFNPEYWAPMLQENLYKALVAMEVADVSLKETLQDGDTVHKDYVGALTTTPYVKGVDVTIQEVTPTDEYITVNTTKESSFYIDNIDKIQNKYDAAMAYIKEATYALKNDIDSAVLAEVLNAFDTFDAGDIGGSNGTAITLSTTNLIQVFADARAKLGQNNVIDNGDFCAVIPYSAASLIEQKATAVGWNLAEAAFKNGYAGDFMGYKIYVSNNLDTSSSRTHCYIGSAKRVSLILQAAPQVLTTQPEKKIGKNYIIWDLYGKKTFKRDSQRFLDLQLA